MIVVISKRKVIVDKKEWEKVKNLPWHIETGHGYVVRRNSNKNKFYLHREILGITETKQIVDHINREKLDNRKNNLRITNKSVNALNSKIACDNTSGTKGVSFVKRIGKWRSYISKHGKQYNLGYYRNKYDAALARRVGEKLLTLFFID